MAEHWSGLETGDLRMCLRACCCWVLGVSDRIECAVVCVILYVCVCPPVLFSSLDNIYFNFIWRTTARPTASGSDDRQWWV